MAKNITVYSIPTCPYCIRAKQFLTENNIAFNEIDISANQQAAQEMMQKSGQIGVPVIEIDGEIIIGFDQGKLKANLGL